jgi:hypothetical protein
VSQEELVNIVNEALREKCKVIAKDQISYLTGKVASTLKSLKNKYKAEIKKFRKEMEG